MSFGENIGFGDLNYEVGVDVSEGHDALDELESRNLTVGRNTVRTFRRGLDTLVQFSALVGQSIAQEYQLMAQSLFVAAETFIAIGAAEAGSVAFAFSAAMSFGNAMALMAKGLEILELGEQARLDSNNIIGLSTLWMMH